MSEDFKPGEIVDITIKGARVDEWRPAVMELTVDSSADANSDLTTFDLASDQVTVERVTPAEWPPRKGDLWRDQDGDLWFVMPNRAGGLILNGYDGGRHGADYVLSTRGPLALVHREEDVS